MYLLCVPLRIQAIGNIAEAVTEGNREITALPVPPNKVSNNRESVNDDDDGSTAEEHTKTKLVAL